MAIVKLGDIAMEAKSSNKGDKTGIKIVGLEHLTPSNVTLSSWSDDTNNSFTKEFSKGDVLFGRRRAYLKKAAVAPFDGICSGDITVIRAIKDKVDPNLLPFIIQNDFFFDFAVGKSAGSLSPRVKWTHLKEFTIELPSMPKQSKMAETLWSINETKNAYEELINKTDELVKSQFIEMFGDQKENPKNFTVSTLGECCDFYSGTGFPNKYQGNSNGTFPFYKVGDISRNVQNGKIRLVDCENYIEQDLVYVIKGSIIPENTVVFAKIGEALKLNRRALTVCNCLIDNNAMGIKPGPLLDVMYFYQFMTLLDMGEFAGTTTMPSVRKSTLEKVQILIPDKERQEEFSLMRKQSDKSKFALQEAVKNLDALSKKIIAENLIPVGKE